MLTGKVTIVGGGVIGLSLAWRLAAAGHQVALVDPTPVTGGGSWVAGGMLAPLTEARYGEEDLLAIGLASMRRWPDLAAELRGIATDPDLRTDGTLVAALDAADAAQLDILAGHLDSMGHPVEALDGRQLRRLEPGIGPNVRSGLIIPGDVAVDNRKLLRGLHMAAQRCGVEFVDATAESVRPGAVELVGGAAMACEVVVIAAGAWSGALHPALGSLVRPVKGEILRLRARHGALPPPTRTVRAEVASRPVYLVPRAGGELVLGATQYEAGFDVAVTVGGVRDLLADAERVLPGITEYELVESAAGLRAGSRDNLPLIGWLEPGVLAATGHHRNGFLLAPITVDAVLALMGGDPHPAPVTDPARFHQEAAT